MKAAELGTALDARGLTAAAPFDHPITGASAARWVGTEHLVAAAEAVLAAGYFYESMTCVDRLDPHGVFELVHTFARWDAPERLALRTWVPKDGTAPSLSGVYPIAAWNEREAWEFYGLDFSGHPNLTWLLLPEDTGFRPLLKSFTAPPPSIYDATLTPAAAPAPAEGGR